MCHKAHTVSHTLILLRGWWGWWRYGIVSRELNNSSWPHSPQLASPSEVTLAEDKEFVRDYSAYVLPVSHLGWQSYDILCVHFRLWSDWVMTWKQWIHSLARNKRRVSWWWSHPVVMLSWSGWVQVLLLTGFSFYQDPKPFSTFFFCFKYEDMAYILVVPAFSCIVQSKVFNL